MPHADSLPDRRQEIEPVGAAWNVQDSPGAMLVTTANQSAAQVELTNRARDLVRSGDKPTALATWLEVERRWPEAEKAAAKPIAALLLDLGNTDSALERIDRIVTVDAATAKLRLRALHQLDRHEDLIQTIMAHKDIDDVTFAALAVRILRERDESETARQLLDQARRRWPQEVRLATLSVSDPALKNNAEAVLVLLDKLPEPLKNHGDLIVHRARALFRIGRLDEAEALCQERLKTIPEDRQLLVLLARIVQKSLDSLHQSSRTRSDIDKCWEAVLTRWPDHEDALCALTSNAIEYGTRDEAALAIKRLSDGSNATRTQKLTRLQARFADRFDEDALVAKTWRSQLEHTQGSSKDVRCIALALARLEQQRGEWSGTLKALDRAGEDADTEEARLLGAQALFELGRYRDVVSRIGDITTWNKRRAKALDLVFESLIRDGSPEDAKALSETPAAHSHPGLQITLGRIQYRQQNHEAALSHFQKAADREPEDQVEARIWVVRTLEITEGFQRAANEVKRYVAASRKLSPVLQSRLWIAAGDLETAERSLVLAIRDTSCASDYHALARFQYQYRRWDDAWRTIRSAERAGVSNARLATLQQTIERGFQAVGLKVPENEREEQSLYFRSSEQMVGALVTRLLTSPPNRLSRPARLGNCIALVINSLGPGGAERQLVNLVNALVARHPDDEVHVLCTHLDRTERDRFYVKDLDPRVQLSQYYDSSTQIDPSTIDSLSANAGLLEHLQPRNRVQLITQLAATLEKLRPDVVHGWLDETLVNVTLAGYATGVPRIVGRWGNMPPGVGRLMSQVELSNVRYLEQAYKEIVRLPGLVLTSNSRRASDAYAQLMDVQPSDVGVVYNGLDASQLLKQATGKFDPRKHLGIPSEALVLGSVFTLTEHKRPSLWVDVIARLARRNSRWRFVLVGDGPMRSAIERLASEAGIDDKLYLVGSQKEIGAWYASFDVTLLTSRTEGVSNVAIESQLCSCPVVAPDVGGLPEAIADGESGKVLDTADPDQFVDAVERIVLNTVEHERFSVNAARFAAKKFSLDTMVQRYRSLLVDKPILSITLKRPLPETKCRVSSLPAPVTRRQSRHVALAGVSYSGSTLISHVLGNLKGVENVGESHWLTNIKQGDGRPFKDISDDNLVHCSSCGPAGCSIFDRAFRNSLDHDPTNWYERIAERLSCTTLVSSDKNFIKITSKDPSLCMDTLVVFKSPQQAWYSNHRKILNPIPGMNPVVDLEKYLTKWSTDHERFLDHFDNVGDKKFMYFDKFCESPEHHLASLCAFFGLTWNPDALERNDHSSQHTFGGNVSVHSRINTATPMIIEPLADVVLPPEHVSRIASDQRVEQVFQRLLSRYRSDFCQLSR